MTDTQSPRQTWRQLRERRGLSIRELERRTGVNRGRLSMIERGLPASPDEAARIVAALAQPEASPKSDTAA